jgi:hypothetical protein
MGTDPRSDVLMTRYDEIVYNKSFRACLQHYAGTSRYYYYASNPNKPLSVAAVLLRARPVHVTSVLPVVFPKYI